MTIDPVTKAIKDGHSFALQLRQQGALPEHFADNVAMWVDGPGQPYRNHILRPKYLVGFTAGYHGKSCPAA